MRVVWPLVLLLTSLGCAMSDSDDDIIEVSAGEAPDEVVGKADGVESNRVELKVTLAPASIASARSKLHLTSSSSQKRYIWFYDTPDLALFAQGLVLRARDV